MRPTRARVDIVLLDVAWPSRALIRAQLIEQGFEVVATSTWPMMRRYLRPGFKPRLALVDLQGLQNPEEVLNDLGLLMKSGRVLVIAALGTVTPSEIERHGFHFIRRPVSVGDVTAAVVREIGMPGRPGSVGGPD
jgi:hypothetical protein